MSDAPEVSLWQPERELLSNARAGVGTCVAVVRRSPDRGEHEPCEDVAGLVSWGDVCVMLVADGVGGHPGGAAASRLVLETVAQQLPVVVPSGQALPMAVLAAIQDANDKLLALRGGAATTVLATVVDGERLWSCHAGDSELMVVGQRGRMKHHTVSHTPVSYGSEAGLIAPDEQLDHAERHLISSWVGMPAMRVEVASSVPLAKRDTIVLASDGLWDNLHLREVAEVVRTGPLEAAAQELLAICDRRMAGADTKVAGKPDDLGILIYRAR